MKKLLSLLLSVVMLLSLVPSAFAAGEYDTMLITDEEAEVKVEFTDIKSHWANAVIRDLAKAGYVNGMGDGTYAPNSQVTRAQFIKMATELFDEEISGYELGYKDVESDQWFAPYIQKADCLALIDDGMKLDNKILPDTPITREEAATIAAKAAEAKGAKKNKRAYHFSDESEISGWAYSGVMDAANYGMIKGYDTGDYKPKATITRAEAAQILLRLIEIDTRMQIYVDSENGDDNGNGTSTEPLKTIEAARDLASNYAKDMKNDISILMRGKFRLDDTLVFTAENSGANGFDFVYTSWGAEKPVITMSDEFADFKLHDESKNIWKVYVGEGKHSRQAYFNDVRGVRARTIGYLKNAKYEEKSYYTCDNTELLDVAYPDEIDMVFHINWCNPRFLIKSIEKLEDGRVKIIPSDYFMKYKQRIDFAGAVRKDSTPGYLENAYEFLDDAGEWYLNRHDGYMYYIPRSGEDMSKMTLKLPLGEQLIDASGTAEAPVTNLTFDNVTFEGTTWLYVDEAGGHHDCQNGHIREEPEYSDRAPGAAIHFEHCRNITMTNNVIRQIGRTGVEFMVGSKHIDFIGNEVYNISGVGVTVDDIGLTGYPERRTEESYCEYVRVNNNYVHDIGLDVKSSGAISMAWPRHSQFNHNEISAVPYSGFHVGYSWDAYNKTGSIMYDVEINYNYIHDMFTDRVYDGGGIYTLGSSSLECEKTNIEKNNRMFGNYLASSWTCAMIYPDQGSTSWYVKDNVIDQSRVKYLENNLESDAEKNPWAIHMHASTIKWMTFRNNYATCDYAYRYGMMNQQESVVEPLNIVTPGDWDNWPQEAKDIMKNAGIEDKYKQNFKLYAPKVLACDNRRQSLALETPTYSGIYVIGDNATDAKNKECWLGDYKLELWIDDPEAVELTPDGYFIAHKSGLYEAEVAVTIGERTHLQHFKLECGDEIERLALNVDHVNIIEGAALGLGVSAHTTFGNKLDITTDAEINLVPDEPILTLEKVQIGTSVSSEIKVKPLALKGETVIRGTIKYGDILQEIEIPARIIKYGSDEGATLPFTKVDFTKGWKNPGTKTEDGGVLVGGKPNHYSKQFQNELIGFDMMIQPGNSWPGFVICDSDQMGDYTANDCYMIAFKNTFIEVQRFNQGKRTVVFGDEVGGARPIGGPGVPNVDGAKVLEYGKRYSVVTGALDTEEGTRIILNINGKNIIDFTDKNSDRIPAFGYYATYNPLATPGGTTYWEYSGITE